MTFGALSTRRHRPFWPFLFFVAILTPTSVSGGVRALRAKTRTAVHRNAWDVGWPALLTTSSLAAAFYGVGAGHHLFTAFSVIGLFVGSGQLAYWLTPPSHPMHWWFEHMGSVLGSCIAATTAFLVVNAGRLGVETLRRFRTGSDPFTVLHGADECNAVKGSDPVHYSLRNTVCGSSVVARRAGPATGPGPPPSMGRPSIRIGACIMPPDTRGEFVPATDSTPGIACKRSRTRSNTCPGTGLTSSWMDPP